MTQFLFPLPLLHSEWRRVALLGIAQRLVSIKYAQKPRKQKWAKALPVSIKTIGDWIKVKRLEKNITSGHVALKMGIATSVVLSWEDGSAQPNDWQLKFLRDFLGFDYPTFLQNPDEK